MSVKKRLTTIVADNNRYYSRALTEFLSANKIDVIAQAETKDQILSALASETPDVLIYDYLSYSERFENTMSLLLNAVPDLKVLVVSLDNSEGDVKLYLSCGAKGFCDKNIKDYQDLVNAIKKVSSGETVVIMDKVLTT
ncbi:MAG: response regulator transcription factor [Bacteroidia bacterium]|nr:response regulator transcription factor [Bacteroidia bacterium]